MNLPFNFRGPVDLLSTKLEQVVARINLLWGREHNPATGVHGNISSLQAGGIYQGTVFPTLVGQPRFQINAATKEALFTLEQDFEARAEGIATLIAPLVSLSTPTGGVQVGLTTAGVGVIGLVVLATGQLQFPATQNPSANVNTLDDYEEGTFTPTLTFGGAAVGLTFGVVGGRYVKVGEKVWFSARLILTAKGASVGAAIIGALPFTSANDTIGAHAGLTIGNNTAGLGGIFPTGWVQPNTATVVLYTGPGVQMTDANFTNTTDFTVSGTYRV